MKNYVVNANIELPAVSSAEAEDLIMGMEIVDMDGNSLTEVFISIEEVVEVE